MMRWSSSWAVVLLLCSASPALAGKTNPITGAVYGSRSIVPRQHIVIEGLATTQVALVGSNAPPQTIPQSGQLNWPQVLPAGTHEFEAVLFGYETLRVKKVIAGTATYEIALEQRPCPSIQLKAPPHLYDAKVKVSGADVGRLGDVIQRWGGDLERRLPKQSGCALSTSQQVPVQIELQGYETLDTVVEFSENNRSVELPVVLKPASGMLLVESDLAGVGLLIDGGFVGNFPPVDEGLSTLLVARLREGKHTIQLRNPNRAGDEFLDVLVFQDDDPEDGVPLLGPGLNIDTERVTRLTLKTQLEPPAVDDPVTHATDPELWEHNCFHGLPVTWGGWLDTKNRAVTLGIPEACLAWGWWARWSRYDGGEEAKQAFHRACRLGDPRGCEAYGWLQRQDGAEDDAIEQYREACELETARQQATNNGEEFSDRPPSSSEEQAEVPLACRRAFLSREREASLDPTLAMPTDGELDVLSFRLAFAVTASSWWWSDYRPSSVYALMPIEFGDAVVGISIGPEVGYRTHRRVVGGQPGDRVHALHAAYHVSVRLSPFPLPVYLSLGGAAGAAVKPWDSDDILDAVYGVRFGLGYTTGRALVGGTRFEIGLMRDSLPSELSGQPLKQRVDALEANRDVDAFVEQFRGSIPPLWAPYVTVAWPLL